MTKDTLALRARNLASLLRSGALTPDEAVAALRADLGLFVLPLRQDGAAPDPAAEERVV